MDADAVNSLARATLDGSMPFPHIVGKLIAEGVEYYHVDYAANTFTFYSASGSTVTAPLPFEGLPAVSADFDAPALKAAILDSQRHGQPFRQFCDRAKRAACRAILPSCAGSGSPTWADRATSTWSGFRGRDLVETDESLLKTPRRSGARFVKWFYRVDAP